MVKEETHCRLCGGDLVSVLDLGKIYPSAFVKEGDKLPEKAPLVLAKCAICHLVQLKHTVNLDQMYRQYWYTSSLNKSMVSSLQEIAKRALYYKKLNDEDVVIDIGCFPSGTDITMSDGTTKDISKVCIGDKVITDDNKNNVVLETFNRRYVGNIITLHFGKSSITSTKDHPILKYNKNFDIMEYIPACSFNVGDFIILPRNNNKEVNNSNDLYTLYGWYLAEGNIINSHKPKVCGINLTLGIHENNYISEIEEIAKNLGYNVKKSIRPDKNTIDIRIYSKKLAEEVIKLFGRGSGNKFIAGDIFNQSESNRKALLKSYFKGDGHLRCVEKAYQYYLSTKSKQLQKDVKRLLIQLGAFPNTYEYKNGQYHFYSITLCGTDVNILENVVKYKSKSKKIVLSDYVIVPINKIDITFPDTKVYNLKVDNNNTYIANNVAVHNCNDGTLFKFFPDYCYKVGFDPALNLEKEATKNCDLFINDYFCSDLLPSRLYQKAKIITSIAMFYDLPNPHDFIKNVKNALADDGIWVIQFTDLTSMLKATAFDNICHEHLEYYTLDNLNALMHAHELEIYHAEYNMVNGGSLRIFVQRDSGLLGTHAYIQTLLDKEREYLTQLKNPFGVFAHKIHLNELAIKNWLRASREQGLKTYILGASTKGNTLLQVWNLTKEDFPYALEVNSAKFGLKTIGSFIDIISEKEGLALKPNQLFILPWHFIDTLTDKLDDYLNEGGRLITPLPSVSMHYKENGLKWVLEQKASAS